MACEKLQSAGVAILLSSPPPHPVSRERAEPAGARTTRVSEMIRYDRDHPLNPAEPLGGVALFAEFACPSGCHCWLVQQWPLDVR